MSTERSRIWAVQWRLRSRPVAGVCVLGTTLPLPDGSWMQQRISTQIAYPAGLEQARKLAEELGRDMEPHRMGLDLGP